MMGGCNTRNM